jgi:hypothetical protein
MIPPGFTLGMAQAFVANQILEKELMEEISR